MANSESEDFESADEMGSQVLQENGCQMNSGSQKYPAPENQSNPLPSPPHAPSSTLTAPSQLDPSCEGSTIDASDAQVPGTVSSEPSSLSSFEASLSSKPLNPESLGAKPKLLQKMKTQSYSKRSGQRPVEAMESLFSNEEETSEWKRPSRQPVSILPSEIVPSDNNRVSGNSEDSSSTETKDIHDSIQPLLDKLSTLDVVEPPEKIANNAEDQSVWTAWSSWMSGQVSQGLSTVSSAIESGLGAVDPEEMARLSLTPTRSDSNSMDCSETNRTNSAQASSFNVGNVLRFMESTGGMIVSSGLNTLESLGRKTMDALQEGDPGLRKKRALFCSDKPVLTQVLKEARLKADLEDQERSKSQQSVRAHFEIYFDDYKGMVFLESFEMLSSTCQFKLEMRLQSVSGSSLLEFQRVLMQIKEQCEVPDDDDDEDDDEDYDRGSSDMFEREMTAIVRNLLLPISFPKLMKVCEDTDSWLSTMKSLHDEKAEHCIDEDNITESSDRQTDLREMHQQAIRSLARFTAAVIEHFHETAELILLKKEHKIELECECIVMMTSVICSRVSSVAARFSELLSASANRTDCVMIDHNDVNLLITNIFLEASNSSSYIQDASSLFIPVVQLGAVQ